MTDSLKMYISTCNSKTTYENNDENMASTHIIHG